jgi:hypothetical protein
MFGNGLLDRGYGMKISVKTNKTAITATADCEITSGMVGLQVEIEYGDGWEGLKKFVSFRVGEFQRTMENVETETTVPWEMLRHHGKVLYVGVEGRTEDGKLVIPTVWASVGTIKRGASRGIVPETDSKIPIWNGSFTEGDV